MLEPVVSELVFVACMAGFYAFDLPRRDDADCYCLGGTRSKLSKSAT
jgi:hypothetical protein